MTAWPRRGRLGGMACLPQSSRWLVPLVVSLWWSWWPFVHLLGYNSSTSALDEECTFLGVLRWAKVLTLLYSRQIRDTVNMIICEQMLVNYISLFKDAYWPGGKLAPHVKVRTDSERFETKEQAQQKLLDNIPGRAAGVACSCSGKLRRCSSSCLIFFFFF